MNTDAMLTVLDLITIGGIACAILIIIATLLTIAVWEMH